MEQRISVKKLDRSKFFRIKDGVEIYGMGKTKLEEVARDAQALYKVDKVVLINREIFERYLESFRVTDY